MTPYEAKHEKTFTGKSFFSSKECPVTAQSKVAELLNDQWIYSSHWPEEGDEWIDKARKDVIQATEFATARLNELKEAESILKMINP